jgi:hypothetical protein
MRDESNKRRAGTMANKCNHPKPRGMPTGYVAWFEWLDKHGDKWRQERCPKCGLWVVWTRKRKEGRDDGK